MNENERKHAQALILAGCIGKLDALISLMDISHDVYKERDQNTDVMRGIVPEVRDELKQLQEELHAESWGRKIEVVR